MLTTYVLQATLVTIYFMVLLANPSDDAPGRTHPKSFLDRTVAAIKDSTGSFLSALFFFCISMLFATMISLARIVASSPKSQSQNSVPLTLTAPSGPILSMLVSLYSVLPVAILQMVSAHLLRRVKGRRLLWILVAALVGIVLALGVTANYNRTLLNNEPISMFHFDPVLTIDDQVNWEGTCVSLDLFRHLRDFATGLGAVLFITITLYTTRPILPTLITSAKFKESSWHNMVKTTLMWQGLLLTFATMWFCIGWLILTRRRLDRYGGDTNKDLDLSFGQVLALATWVPVLVEFGYGFMMQPNDALTGRLTRRFVVVAADLPSDATEPGLFKNSFK